MSRKGQHWVTQQLRRALLDFAQAPETELSTRSVAIHRNDPGDNAAVSPKTPRRASSATETFGDQDTG